MDPIAHLALATAVFLVSHYVASTPLRVTRHPMMWGIALWAAAHILARGDTASLNKSQ